MERGLELSDTIWTKVREDGKRGAEQPQSEDRASNADSQAFAMVERLAAQCARVAPVEKEAVAVLQ